MLIYSFILLIVVLSVLSITDSLHSDGEGGGRQHIGGGGGGGGGNRERDQNYWHHSPPLPHHPRNFTLHLLLKIASPVIRNLAEGTLRQKLPSSVNENRHPLASMEAFARTFAGIASWLESNATNNREENAIKHELTTLTRLGIRNLLNDTSPDWMNFTMHNQCVVELAHITLGFIRSPTKIWDSYSDKFKLKIIKALKLHRFHKIPHNNWILFPALIEAFIYRYYDPQESEMSIIDYSIRRMMTWYVGDGWYSDGSLFHFDYYNSLAIHTFLIEIMILLKEANPIHPLVEEFYSIIFIRAYRHAKQLEMLITPDGSIPMFGRSNVYRFGIFHLLSRLITLHSLSENLEKNLGGLRNGLTAVIYRFAHMKHLFDKEGWLVEGVIGSQPSKSDYYVSRGSVYMCTMGIMHAALPPNDRFWTATDKQWTQRAIWSGNQHVELDYPDDWK